MLVTTVMQRVFIMKENGRDVKLADPNSSFEPKTVLNHYSLIYPVLTTATIDPVVVEDDKLVYRFVSTIGTKG